MLSSAVLAGGDVSLKSNLFRGDQSLEACLVNDSAHLTPGTRGKHVPKVQRALIILDGALIDVAEVTGGVYGATTAKAVLDYKSSRRIINFSYQSQPDNIVGKMTIASLDREMAVAESRPPLTSCLNESRPGSGSGGNGSTRSSVVGDSAPVGLTRLRVEFQNAITPSFGVDRGRPLLLLIARANLLLAPHGMAIDFRPRLKAFPFAITITPEVASDAQGLRRAAEKADAGTPGVLRIIFCDFDGPEKLKTTGFSAGPRVGIDGFPNFVVLNPLISHPDHGTLLHEMVHACNDNLMFFGTLGHDTDPTSVFSHALDRPILRKEHADLLRVSFFGR